MASRRKAAVSHESRRRGGSSGGDIPPRQDTPLLRESGDSTASGPAELEVWKELSEDLRNFEMKGGGGFF